MKKGSLFLIPTPISQKQSLVDILHPSAIETISELDYFIVEKAKSARAVLKDIPLKNKIQDIEMMEIRKQIKEKELENFLLVAKEGRNIGLMSDAGIPSVADPGYKVVAIAQKMNIKTIPFIGPSSIILALMSSGLNGQSFCFHGYLPKERDLKREKIKTLEEMSFKTKATQIIMETPYKNQHMLDDILDICDANTQLCIAFDVMGEDEFIYTKTVKEWKKQKIILTKKPALFLINR